MVFNLTDIARQGAQLFSDRIAFKCGQSTLTFEELMHASRQVAGFLRATGVSKTDRVAVYLPRSIESILAIYGTFMAGAAFVPINPFLPEALVKRILRDSQSKALISTSAMHKKVRKLDLSDTAVQGIIGAEYPEISSVPWKVLREGRSGNYQEVSITPQDLAYIMYTSGSTGNPKGIMHTHQSALNYAFKAAAIYEVHPNDIVASHAPIYFDISTFALYAAPLSGATTVIIPEAHIAMPASLTQLLQDEKVTIWYSVPKALTEMLEKGVLDKRDITSLRWVKFGGEVFPVQKLKALMKHWPKAQFSNVYGPAEINQCTFYHFTDVPSDQVVPLGHIWGIADYKIVNPDNEPVDKNTPGELCVRTPTMMSGYWDNPELTAASILEEEIAAGFVAKYYKTGDLVCEQPDGKLLFKGRIDRQVKVRGYRVELDEIEIAIGGMPGVQENAVVQMEAETGGGALVAAIIQEPEGTLTEQDVRRYCVSRLPAYSVPDKFYFVDALPRTGSGKLSRQVLKEIIS